MPNDDTGRSGGDAELRAAVKALMRFRNEALRHPADVTRGPSGLGAESWSGIARATNLTLLACLENPLWHRVEEAMK